MHECPECYQVCSCGGDIDDLVMDFGDGAADRCTHCPPDGYEDDGGDYLDEEDSLWDEED